MDAKKSSVEELFIVGNGFDLQCGLGTTYENFLKFTLAKLDESTQDLENYSDFDLDSIACKFDNAFQQYDFAKENWHSRLPSEYFPNTNIWYHIFLYEKMIDNKDWSAIETMISTYLSEHKIIRTISHIILEKKSKDISSFYSGDLGTYFVTSKNPDKIGLFAKIAFIISHKKPELIRLPGAEAYETISKILIDPEPVSLAVIKELVTQILLHELNELEYDFQCFLRYRMESTHKYLDCANDLLRKMLEPDQDFS